MHPSLPEGLNLNFYILIKVFFVCIRGPSRWPYCFADLFTSEQWFFGHVFVDCTKMARFYPVSFVIGFVSTIRRRPIVLALSCRLSYVLLFKENSTI